MQPTAPFHSTSSPQARVLDALCRSAAFCCVYKLGSLARGPTLPAACQEETPPLKRPPQERFACIPVAALCGW